MHAYEQIGDGLYRSHETVQFFGWATPVTCLCGLTSDQLTRLVNPGGARANVNDCIGCGPRRTERYVERRASEGDPWHSIDRADPIRTLCSLPAGSDWIFYRPTGRPVPESRCKACEQARAAARH
jgi:hypothetical protein